MQIPCIPCTREHMTRSLDLRTAKKKRKQGRILCVMCDVVNIVKFQYISSSSSSQLFLCLLLTVLILFTFFVVAPSSCVVVVVVFRFSVFSL